MKMGLITCFGISFMILEHYIIIVDFNYNIILLIIKSFGGILSFGVL